MTESEFHEFMITVGYRYESKSKSAFNSFEGFKTIIEFNQKDNRYSLRVKAGTDDLSLLKQKLKDYSDSHKNHVMKAKYADKYIKINIRMTIDSEIDKNELKQLVHFMTELFKSGMLVPLCSVCARNRKTGLYIVGKELLAVCDKCLARKQRQYEIRPRQPERRGRKLCRHHFHDLQERFVPHPAVQDRKGSVKLIRAGRRYGRWY